MNLSEHEKFLRSFDWSSTCLGPMKDWTNDLRKHCVMLTSDCRPAALYYGDSKTIIYNEPYISVIGNKHPTCLGTSFEEAWSSIADRFIYNFEDANLTGKATWVSNALVNIQRRDHTEEAYFSWSVIPMLSPEGAICYYNPIFETTRQIVVERRMKSLLNLGQSISTGKSLPEFWLSVLEGLRPSVDEVPFCLVYSSSTDNSERTNHDWALEGTIGVRQGEDVDFRSSCLFNTPNAFAKLQEAFTSGKPTFLRTEDGTLSSQCVENLQTRGHDEKFNSAVILSIAAGAGFLILGINPRQPYDSDYEDFLYVLGRMLTTAGASAMLFEEEIRRGQLVADQLAIKSQEAKDSETRFRKLADTAPVSIFQMDASGTVQYANDYWHSITGHPKEITHPVSWYATVLDDDLPRIHELWQKLIHDGSPITCELRLKKPWARKEVSSTVQDTTWIIAAAYPEYHPDGYVKSVTGCMTEISQQKWAEGFQKQQTQQAVELKRRQEQFIDVTSHELRNPMSAILHCADEIQSSLLYFQETTGDAKLRELLTETADAVSTIIHCSEHQKRIVDDILTLSKLESDLLIIAPVDVQPLSVIHKALKMFEGELHKGDVRMDLVIDRSFYDLEIDWARLDPSRLLQIIINLAGNAVKFTRSEPKREIQIKVNVSLEQPVNGVYGIDYLSSRVQRADQPDGEDWGNGRVFYLHIAIIDTGRGLSPKEKTLMFQRFVQASPRTQVQYGGSGLGLFISKELAERQGGAIGVESGVGTGSTFAFYIKARRIASPDTAQSIDSLQPINKHDISAAASNNQSDPSMPQLATILPSKPKTRQLLRPSKACQHILIVEDNLVNQKVLSRQLKNIGCEVHVANHGLEAIAFLENSCFWKNDSGQSTQLSVILMDLEMPVMTGLECVRKIRDLQKEGTIRGHVPIIAVTANARNEKLEDAKDCGMDAVVTKPFRIPELVPEMERLVGEFMNLNTAAGSWPMSNR